MDIMPITIKTPEEQQKMRMAGRAAASVLEMIEPHVQPGVTTEKLNQICHDFIVNDLQAIPAPLNYNGFPKSICTSVNHVVCHGIPSDKNLKKGDIINIDITVILDGYHGDTSKMFYVGKPSIAGKRVSETAHQAMWLGIEQVKPGACLREIGKAIQQFVEPRGYSTVKEYCGHGIGLGFHEDPQVLHYDNKKVKTIIQPGMCFTVEPMINAGKASTRLLPDDWTVITRDRSLSAQWEHTILVTDTGYEVLTLRQDETLPIQDQSNNSEAA